MRIVSANYRDRNSPDRWLMRDAGTPPEAAKTYKTVLATRVVFVPSSDYEAGFGCSVVAQCGTAVGSQDSKSMNGDWIRLRFEQFSGCFYRSDNGDPVEECKMLFLDAEGGMHAMFDTVDKAVSDMINEANAAANDRANDRANDEANTRAINAM